MSLFTAQRTPSGPNKWKCPLGRGKTHTCPLHIQKDICVKLPKRLTHTKGLLLLPSPLETDKKGSFLIFHKGGWLWQGREHTLNLLTWFIPKLTQCGEEDFRKWADYVQEKISCKQLTGNLHEKRGLKIHRLLEACGEAPSSSRIVWGSYWAWNSPHPPIQWAQFSTGFILQKSSSGTWCDLNFNLTFIKSSQCSRLSIHLSHYSTEGMSLSALYIYTAWLKWWDKWIGSTNDIICLSEFWFSRAKAHNLRDEKI